MRRVVDLLRRRRQPSQPRALLNLLYEGGSDFRRAYTEGLAKTGTPDAIVDGYPKRFVRFYNTAQYFVASRAAEGNVIECGCWRGLSMFIFASLQRLAEPGFDGRGFTVVDSFEGLAAPDGRDVGSVGSVGQFACDCEVVRGHLSAFPRIEMVKGWIPAVLSSLPEATYRFVHLDLDHYAPIRGALDYFGPRIVPGGFLVVDEYGSGNFPGAKRAVEEYTTERRVPFVGLSSGQAVMWK